MTAEKTVPLVGTTQLRDSGGHMFDEDLRCGNYHHPPGERGLTLYCGVSWFDHQTNPTTCELPRPSFKGHGSRSRRRRKG